MRNWEYIFTWLLRISLLISGIIFFVQSDISNGIGAILAFFISLLPLWLAEEFKFKLPWEIEMFVSLVLVAHIVLGEGFKFYQKFGYYDKILHFNNSIGIAIFVFLAGYALFFASRPKLNIGFAIITVFLCTVGIGALWEIGEYASDTIFGFHSQGSPMDSPLIDTMKDLIYDMIGGAFGAIATAIFIRREKKQKNNL